ncbi:MAG TPA: polyprenyl synthetase family protein, partial [Streptomyces sp.]|nr:polyprenyl synthetase family protein [Streptomyces sp.]
EKYGYHLGLAFQAVDDLLGIWGDPVSTGKQTWSDLRQRKKSLPVVAALAADGPASRRLGEILAADAKSSDFENFSEEEFAARAALIEEAGGREWTADEARRQHAVAIEALGRVDMPEQVRAQLIALADFVVVRKR